MPFPSIINGLMAPTIISAEVLVILFVKRICYSLFGQHVKEHAKSEIKKLENWKQTGKFLTIKTEVL